MVIQKVPVLSLCFHNLTKRMQPNKAIIRIERKLLNRIYYVLKNELILSEYPGSTPPRKDHFPKRNRIIAGLSQKLLVTEADLKSGTMITVGFALEQGKDVFAVPGRVYDSKGCNALIQQGAKLVMNVEDILEE